MRNKGYLNKLWYTLIVFVFILILCLSGCYVPLAPGEPVGPAPSGFASGPAGPAENPEAYHPIQDPLRSGKQWPRPETFEQQLIVFEQGRSQSDGQDIRLYDLYNEVIVALPCINSKNNDSSPSISGDGRYIAFTSNRPGGAVGSDIYLYERGTNSLLNLPGLNTDGIETCPSITWDVHYIAFNYQPRDSNQGWRIRLYDHLTGNLVRLPGLEYASSNATFTHQINDEFPCISPEGRYITFSSIRPGGHGLHDVYLYDRDSSSLVDLPGINSSLRDQSPTISPDGRYIVFISDREGAGRNDIYLYDRESSLLVNLPGLNTQYDEACPFYVDVGSGYIAFASNRTDLIGGSEIYLYSLLSRSMVNLPNLNSKTDDCWPRTTYIGPRK